MQGILNPSSSLIAGLTMMALDITMPSDLLTNRLCVLPMHNRELKFSFAVQSVTDVVVVE